MSKQRASSKAKKRLTTMGIVVGGMRADSAKGGAEELRKVQKLSTSQMQR